MEPPFTKEGALEFLQAQTGQLSCRIDIEIADDHWSQFKGLMWRRTMEPDQGMLFILDRTEVLSFWMRNTHIPLDIIFVDEQMRIINIRENTTPYSLKRLSSEGPARYAVEVNAGFCARHGIRPGDHIRFFRLEG